jgi:hypothetical protein
MTFRISKQILWENYTGFHVFIVLLVFLFNIIFHFFSTFLSVTIFLPDLGQNIWLKRVAEKRRKYKS